MISCFSVALIGAFRSLLFHSWMICSLGGPQSHGSPVVVFLDCGHPRFWNFYSTHPVDVVRVKSYMNCIFDSALSSNKGHDEGRRVWHRNFKRTRRPTHHQRIQKAHVHRSILSVWFTPPSISKTRYCQVPLRAHQRSLNKILRHLRGEKTSAICSGFEWLSFFFLAETYQDRITKQQCRSRQRVQSYCGFTLCQRSVPTASPFPTTTRRTRCFQVGDYAKISVSTTKRRCRPG